ncbi:MAG TPA: PKD domain-containing protein [Phycisphaerae bacterium]|nr:PKD domain-containing protein [Phycisphaerae bacterium]HOJ54194.1 PKD domain-containing protein [Phycisphaerae bacterium]HOL26615.1 PKD domain-containing protein [Phycisphaerae bacterium]HPP20349.1 PKD domain-containing protein [Phycisphaerae bacterium]HPU32750.1 PKD domain-containing protein [Phycisphaerae bacterium]
MAAILLAGMLGLSCLGPGGNSDDASIDNPIGTPIDDPSDDQVLDSTAPQPPGAPIANGGGNQVVDEGATVVLDGSQSRSPDEKALAFSWQQVEGIPVTLTDAQTARATFTAPDVDADQTLTFLLTVSDGINSSEDKVKVEVKNRVSSDAEPPALAVIASTTEGEAPLSVEFQVATLDGRSLPAGTYVWDFDDGSGEEGETVTHVFTTGRALPYLVSVCLVTGTGGCSEDSPKAQLPISVKQKGSGDGTPSPANQPPIAAAGADVLVNEGELVTLDGSASTDPDGETITFEWQQIGGPAVTLSDPAAVKPTFTAPQVALDTILSFKLIIRDAQAAAEDLVDVYVKDIPSSPPEDQPPVIAQGESASLSLQAGQAGTIGLSATDPDAAPGSLVWSILPVPAAAHGTAKIISGSPSNSGGTVIVEYQPFPGHSGSDLFGVRVDDGRGGTDSIAISVTIMPPPNQPPVITQGSQISLTVQQGGTGTLQLSATDADAAAGSLVWTTGPAGHGTVAVTAGSPSSSGGSVTVSYQPAAGYSGPDAFTVQVSDGKGGSASTVVNVTVNGETPPPPGPAWYVAINDPAASDTAADAGTQAKPFKTLQKAAAVVRPGDTVYVKAGRYTSTNGLSYSGTLLISTSGTADKPITFARYGNDEVIIDATSTQTYGIAVGDVRNNKPVAYINIRGFKVTGAIRDGIYVFKGSYVNIQDCECYSNNRAWEGGQVAYYSGICASGGDHITVEDCRVYNNGGGIAFVETDYNSTDPTGSKYCTIRRNFIYCNAFSGNYGNSTGFGMRFGERSLIESNVIYDNPDAAINGLGNVYNRFLRNALFNSWQQPGNREGIKFCVRGGGGNLVAFNISAFNANTGFDSTSGVGDVVINNTFYHNDRWGILLEGRYTLLMNNISFANNPNNALGRRDIEVNSNGMHPSSDYNLIGDAINLPLVSKQQMPQPHTINQNPKLVAPDLHFSRSNPQQVIHPEQLFADANHDGKVTIEEAMADIAARFRLGQDSPARGAGARLSDIQSTITSAIPDFINQANQRISALSGDSVLQSKQSCSMWRRTISYMQSADHGGLTNLSGLRDFAGNPVSLSAPANMGASQQ